MFLLLSERGPANRRQPATALCLSVLRHPLYVALQELVCLYLHTIAPPVRVAITRGLQFRTTFVKLRSDPSRYVIDLKNNPLSDSARHKTAAHYRHAVLPQPKAERMTELIDDLRSFKLTEVNAKRYVFVKRDGRPFSSSAWTGFVKRAWRDFAGVARAAPASAAGAAAAAVARQPPPSLCRTIFVTWLNGVPYSEPDRVFLDTLQRTAAEFQTHTLETANKLYDKDAAAYERLLDVVTFCEEWSVSTATVRSADADEWDDNLDSDDERFDATAPLPRRARAVPDAHEDKEEEGEDDDAAAERLQDGDQEQDDIAAPFPPQAGEEVSEEEVHDDGDNDDSGGDAAIPSAQPKLYLPEAVLERTTRLVWTKVQGARQHSRWGGTRQKKAVTEWRELLLVKWAGYSVAESTWEADIVFYEQHYPNLLAVHAARRVPAKLVGGRRHTNPQTGVPHYKVQWQGTRWTTM